MDRLLFFPKHFRISFILESKCAVFVSGEASFYNVGSTRKSLSVPMINFPVGALTVIADPDPVLPFSISSDTSQS